MLLPFIDATGLPTDPTTPDTERSLDGGAFADCTEEATTISGSNGMAYITLTGAETDCALLAVAAKVASGPQPTLVTLNPRILPVLRSGTAQAGGATSITLDSSASALDDYYNGCIVRTTGGTGGGGTGGASNQARVVTDYVGSTKVATVSPAWETNPSSDTTFEVLVTEFCQFRFSDLQGWRGAQPNALTSGRVEGLVGAMSANVITDAVLDATAGAELADAVWDEATSGHAGGGSTGEALTNAGAAGDPWSTALPGAYGAGTAGKIVGDNLNAIVGDLPTNAELASALDPLPTAAEIASAILAAAVTAPVAPPTAPYTVEDILGWLLAIIKFKRTQTATTETVYADDGSTSIGTSTKADSAGVFSRGEYA